MLHYILYIVIILLPGMDNVYSSPVPETRGMKVRFEDTTAADEIRSYVDTLYNAGFNLIVLETHYHGYTIYPSDVQREYSLPVQRPAFKGWDPLRTTIETAHEKNIAVYAWVQTLYVGNDRVEGKGPVLERYPQWGAVDQHGNMSPAAGEDGYYFLSPFVYEVREYLSTLYTELITEYNIDGIFIDYLRYPVDAQSGESIYDFNETAITVTENELGYSPHEIIPGGVDSDIFRSWTELRIAQTHETMRALSVALREAREDIWIVANVHGGYEPDSEKQDRLRDWVAWERDGLFDEVSTQNYYDDASTVHRIIRKDLNRLPADAFLLPAITVRDIERENEQLETVRGMFVPGVVYFVRSWMTPELYEALRDGPFQTDAYIPTKYPKQAVVHLLNACIDAMNLQDLLDKLDMDTATKETIRETRMYLESLTVVDDRFIRDLELARRLALFL